jgi:hypothetical protein
MARAGWSARPPRTVTAVPHRVSVRRTQDAAGLLPDQAPQQVAMAVVDALERRDPEHERERRLVRASRGSSRSTVLQVPGANPVWSSIAASACSRPGGAPRQRDRSARARHATAPLRRPRPAAPARRHSDEHARYFLGRGAPRDSGVGPVPGGPHRPGAPRPWTAGRPRRRPGGGPDPTARRDRRPRACAPSMTTTQACSAAIPTPAREKCRAVLWRAVSAARRAASREAS